MSSASNSNSAGSVVWVVCLVVGVALFAISTFSDQATNLALKNVRVELQRLEQQSLQQQAVLVALAEYIGELQRRKVLPNLQVKQDGKRRNS